MITIDAQFTSSSRPNRHIGTFQAYNPEWFISPQRRLHPRPTDEGYLPLHFTDAPQLSFKALYEGGTPEELAYIDDELFGGKAGYLHPEQYAHVMEQPYEDRGMTYEEWLRRKQRDAARREEDQVARLTVLVEAVKKRQQLNARAVAEWHAKKREEKRFLAENAKRKAARAAKAYAAAQAQRQQLAEQALLRWQQEKDAQYLARQEYARRARLLEQAKHQQAVHQRRRRAAAGARAFAQWEREKRVLLARRRAAERAQAEQEEQERMRKEAARQDRLARAEESTLAWLEEKELHLAAQAEAARDEQRQREQELAEEEQRQLLQQQRAQAAFNDWKRDKHAQLQAHAARRRRQSAQQRAEAAQARANEWKRKPLHAVLSYSTNAN